MRCAIALLIVWLPTATWAHHSFAMFDMKTEVALSGTVKEVQWENPHAWIQMLVADSDGTTQEWGIETMSPSLLFGRLGWPRDAVKAGDKIVAHIHPLWNGKTGGSLVFLESAKGTFYGLPKSDPTLRPPAGEPVAKSGQ